MYSHLIIRKLIPKNSPAELGRFEVSKITIIYSDFGFSFCQCKIGNKLKYDFLLQSLQHPKNVALDKSRTKGLNKNNVGPRFSEDGFLLSRYKRTHETATELFTKFTLNLSYDYDEHREFTDPSYKAVYSPF